MTLPTLFNVKFNWGVYLLTMIGNICPVPGHELVEFYCIGHYHSTVFVIVLFYWCGYSDTLPGRDFNVCSNVAWTHFCL